MTDLNNGSAGASASGNPQGDTPSPKQILQETKQAAQEQVQGLTSKVQDTAREQVNKHKDTATRTLGDFADAVRKAGDELASKDQSAIGRVVKQAADSLEGLSRSVADKRPEELLDAVRDFGRKNPAAFVGGAVLLGLALGRFAKSSASRPQDSTSRDTSFRSQGASTGSTSSSLNERRSFVDDEGAASTTGAGYYETAGATTTSPTGSGTGIDPTVNDAFGSSTDAGRDRIAGDSLPTGTSGGVQGAQQ